MMNAKSKIVVGLLATSMAMSACTAPTYEGLNAVEDGGYALNATARYMDACPTNNKGRAGELGVQALQEGPNLSLALGGFATDFALNLLGNGINAAIKGRDGAFFATGVIALPAKVEASSNCLVIYRGVRSDTVNSSIGSGLPRTLLEALDLADQPGFYLELKETRLENSRILTVNYLQYAESSANARGSGMKNVSMVIGLAAASIEAGDVGKANKVDEVYRFDLGRLRIGHIYGPELSVSAASPASKPGVYNVIVQVVESDQPNLALQALADAFKSNRADIATAIQN